MIGSGVKTQSAALLLDDSMAMDLRLPVRARIGPQTCAKVRLSFAASTSISGYPT
jgi:hypothetical protein